MKGYIMKLLDRLKKAKDGFTGKHDLDMNEMLLTFQCFMIELNNRNKRTFDQLSREEKAIHNLMATTSQKKQKSINDRMWCD